MIVIRVPASAPAERKYVIDVIFRHWWGIDYILEQIEGLRATEFVAGGGSLSCPDAFLHKADKSWLHSKTLLESGFATEIDLPPEVEKDIGKPSITVFTHSPSSCEQSETSLPFDLLGEVFYHLSRYEEAVPGWRDLHGRFPSDLSLLGSGNLLERPVVNEYLEYLWHHLAGLLPGIERRGREFRILPSHDVDIPSMLWSAGMKRRAKYLVRELFNRGPRSMVALGFESLRYPYAGWAHDPFDTIDELMAISERRGLQSAFYYIPESTDNDFDLGMPIDHPQVTDQWQKIAARGHEIGVHPGYKAADDAKLVGRAAAIIRTRLESLGIDQPLAGGRHHYLRWRSSDTARYWAEAGLEYDSTLGFADRIGFRCGVCYDYPLYDLGERRPLSLVERPLVVMECSAIDSRYMGFGIGDEACRAMVAIKEECRRYSGDFTILWHNNRIVDRREKKLYEAVLDA